MRVEYGGRVSNRKRGALPTAVALCMTEPQPLTATTIVVTRPAHQAGPLCRLIEAQGGRAITFPALEISATDSPQPLLQRLQQFDMAIFISANAVEYATAHISKIPPALTLAAVGKQTAAQLSQRYQHPILTPATQADSEALLALPALQQVTGKHILIIRGDGGRELLAETLAQRGAHVEYAEVYRRVRPSGDLAPLQGQQPIYLLTATSNASLQNLYDMATVPQRGWLLQLPLIVIGQRCVTLAAQLGFRHPATAAHDASDAGLLQAMLRWRHHHPIH